MSNFTRATVRPAVPVVVEEGPTSWGAFVPSIPGAVAAGATREEVLEQIEDALSLYFQYLDEQHETETQEIITSVAEGKQPA